MYAETFDPRLAYQQERREEVFRWASPLLGADDGMTTLKLDLELPPQESRYVIPVLYVRLYSQLRPSDVPWFPTVQLFNRLYEPIPLRPVEYRYEVEMPSFWDHQGPEPIDDPNADWPGRY